MPTAQLVVSSQTTYWRGHLVSACHKGSERRPCFGGRDVNFRFASPVGHGWIIVGSVYRVGGGVSAPRVIYAPDPEFSEEARKAKYQGTVVLWVIVAPDGRTHDIRIFRSLGMGLDQKAIEAICRWKFEPGRKDGIAVGVQVNVEVNFRLY